MIDEELRPLKDRLVAPLAGRLAPAVAPVAVTLAAMAIGLGAALAAAAGLIVLSLVLWLLNRLLDGLDGAVARARRCATDLGGYLDIIADAVVYVAVPLGIAVAVDTRAAWVAVAVLIATFYVNAISWAYLAALLEKRGAGASTTGEVTSIRMPRGLIEGAETIVFYTLMLAIPGRVVEVAAVLAVLVLVTIGQRLLAAHRLLAA